MGQLNVFFFPMLLHGHMIPFVDIAKLFASRGVKSTIITTPVNASYFSKAIERSNGLGFDIGVRIIEFPVVPGLPEGCENGDQLTSPDMFPLFFAATAMLQEQVEQVLEECRPDCLVADMFFPWATDSAAKFGIPRLVFHGTSCFALCATEQLRLHKPFKNLSNESESFAVPNLPHEVNLITRQLPPSEKEETDSEFAKMLIRVTESELSSYGVIVNSFFELEPDYVDHYSNVLHRKAWHIGPVSLCNRGVEDKAERGKKAAIDEYECLKWLDSKKPNSVIYLCFGSVNNFPSSQLHELAMGLEASGQQFIWVVRKAQNEAEKEEWMPEGFKKRMEGEGLIIRGWAPQVLILDHQAIGGFVTHCGWNSTLEGICAGVPMVTWPMFAEQFLNEKLVTEILGTGVAVGTQELVQMGSDTVKREVIEEAIMRVMVGEEAEGRRNKAKALQEMARKAIEEGGSSYSDLSNLIKELSAYHS